MATTPTPLQDPAQPILAGDPQLDDNARATLWDAFNSKDPNVLTNAMQTLVVPDDTKKRLLIAKQQSGSVVVPNVPATNPAANAISTMAAIPQDTLDLAEQHPNVLKALVEGMKSPEKPKGEDEEKEPLSPRLDGQPHFPPIPDGHYRVLASDGGVHDIPHANIERARQIDPLLHVLNQ